MTDPENYPSDDIPPAGGWNRYWRTLYQEIHRFFRDGRIDHENFLRRAGEQDPALPPAICFIRGRFSGRCPR